MVAASPTGEERRVRVTDKREPEESPELGIYSGVYLGINTACSPSPAPNKGATIPIRICIQGLLEAASSFFPNSYRKELSVGTIHHADESAKVSYNSQEPQGFKGLTPALQLL